MASRETATEIVRRLQTAGAAAYWVGGCVRDQLLGQEPGDYDIATSALPDQIEALFPHTIAVGRKFGVILVVEAGCQFQVATFRAEADYQDGRHPSQVTFGDAPADARRRDFTVNGLFLDPVRGQLFDWVRGEADLRAKVIRTIGEADERFAEDHLRLLRAVRFAAQMSFQIAPATLAAIQRHAPNILTVSAERIREELLKLFRPPHAARGLLLLRETRLLAPLLPELAATETCEQSPDFHPEGTVFTHLVRMLEHLPADSAPSLPWAVLLHDIGKPATFERDALGAIHFYGHEKIGAVMAESLLQRLKFPRKQTEEIVACVQQHMQFKDVPQMRKATLRRLLLRPTFALELELHRLDCLGSHGQLEIYHLLAAEREALAREPQLIPPLLTGNDLLALGMEPGPALGGLLAEIREKQLQDELKTAEQARAWAAKKIAISRGSAI
ncbi:MAG: CCA tRNA nucleotidyltransferase [Limisphaerales bacterium]